MVAGAITIPSLEPTFELRGFVEILNALMAVPAMQPVVIDLSRPHFFGPSGMVPLISTIRSMVGDGWHIEVVLPEDPRLESYFETAGWRAAIEGDAAPSLVAKATMTTIVSYETSSEMNSHLRVIMDVVSKVGEYQRGVLTAIEWTVSELADNVLVHSGGATGWMQVVTRPDRGLVDVVIADRGVGIQRTLSAAYPMATTDLKALKLAIEPGITRDQSIGQGNGLAGAARIARASSGYANLMSGSSTLRIVQGHETDMTHHYYQGTVATLTIPTSVEIDVARELWGNVHEPARAFEFTHLTLDGIRFQLREEAEAFANRGTGEELATKLRNLMVEFPSEKVIIDFAGIDITSSSFLDEFLAKLVKSEGVASFFSRFSLVNMSDLVRRAADSVIEQRLRQDGG